VGVVPTATAAATTATATTNDPNERKEAKRNVQKDLIALTNTKCNIPKNSPMPANKKPKRTTEKELVTTRLPPTAVNLGKHPPKDWVAAEAAAAAAAAAAVMAVAVAVAGTVGTLVTLNWRRHLRGRVAVPVETVLFVPINTPPVCLPQSLVSVGVLTYLKKDDVRVTPTAVAVPTTVVMWLIWCLPRPPPVVKVLALEVTIIPTTCTVPMRVRNPNKI